MQTKIFKSSAGGIVIDGEKILTIKWISRDTVEFPKGTIEKGESTETTALREVKEETGYDAIIIHGLGDITYEFDWDDGNHYVKTVTFYIMELANNNKPEPNLQPGEDFENNWISISEAQNTLTHDDSKEILKRLITKLNEK